MARSCELVNEIPDSIKDMEFLNSLAVLRGVIHTTLRSSEWVFITVSLT